MITMWAWLPICGGIALLLYHRFGWRRAARHQRPSADGVIAETVPTDSSGLAEKLHEAWKKELAATKRPEDADKATRSQPGTFVPSFHAFSVSEASRWVSLGMLVLITLLVLPAAMYAALHPAIFGVAQQKAAWGVSGTVIGYWFGQSR